MKIRINFETKQKKSARDGSGFGCTAGGVGVHDFLLSTVIKGNAEELATARCGDENSVFGNAGIERRHGHEVPESSW